MMNPIKSLLIACSLLALASCEKEEKPIEPVMRGDAITTELSVGSDYRYQLFFDLETNAVVGQNIHSIWDLAFETSPDGFRIFLNYADLMSAKNTLETDFSATYTYELPDGLIPVSHIDRPSGNLDSTAIGNWVGTNEVYLINRGFDHQGIQLGFKKIVFLSVDENEYLVKFANLDGSEEITKTIPKDDNYNFTFLSFNNGGEFVNVEPPKEDWDIAFTRFTETLDSGVDTIVYGVTSVLSNRHLVEVARDFESDFDAIVLDDIADYHFSTDINAVGHDWKIFDFDNGFTIDPNLNYIIRSTEGDHYKIHFLDFYDENGDKGHPLFEFQEL